MKALGEYKTWIFDCDGVLLDSNAVKSEAFYEVALPYGRDKAKEFLDYHKRFGGISRFDKFRYFLAHIQGNEAGESDVEPLAAKYGALVRDKLLRCPETSGMRRLLARLRRPVRRIVVSGGLQEEVRQTFDSRGLSSYFDGIFGSPDNKETILKRETAVGAIVPPALVIGDSRYDYECAHLLSFDFIMMTNYTEFESWPGYFEGKNVRLIGCLEDLESELGRV